MGAFAGAERDQPAGQLCRATIGLGVTDPLAVAYQQRMVSPDPRLLAQDLGDA